MSRIKYTILFSPMTNVFGVKRKRHIKGAKWPSFPFLLYHYWVFYLYIWLGYLYAKMFMQWFRAWTIRTVVLLCTIILSLFDWHFELLFHAGVWIIITLYESICVSVHIIYASIYILVILFMYRSVFINSRGIVYSKYNLVHGSSTSGNGKEKTEINQ